MAEINELVSKETLNNVRILEESLGKVVARLNQVAESSEKVDKELMELTNTSKQTSEQQKNLNTKTSEAVKLNKQLQLADDKLVKAKLRFAKATKDQKTELTALINSENKQLGTLDRLIAENKELERQKRKLTSTGAKLRAETLKYNRQIDANSKVLKANRAQSQGLTNTLKGMGQKFLAITGLAAGASIVVRKLGEIFKTAAEDVRQFEETFANVLTLLNEAQKQQFEAILSIGAIDIMAKYGLAIEDVNSALFDAISAGIPAGEAIAFLDESARLAIAGNSELSAVVNGATTVMNAYGSKAGSTTDILNSFFSAQVKGKTTVEAMAANIGKIASTAAAADIPVTELFGTFAGLTKFLDGSEESSTALINVINAMIKPSEKAQKTFADLGIETGITAVKNDGLLNKLLEVAAAYEGNNDVLAELIPNIRAFKGIAGLSSEAISEIEANVLALNDTEAASILVQEAFNEKIKTGAREIKLLSGEWKRLVIEIGGGESIFQRISRFIRKGLIGTLSILTDKTRGARLQMQIFLDLFRKEENKKAEDLARSYTGAVEEIVDSAKEGTIELTDEEKERQAKLAEIRRKAAEKQSAEDLAAAKKLQDAKDKAIREAAQKEVDDLDFMADLERENEKFMNDDIIEGKKETEKAIDDINKQAAEDAKDNLDQQLKDREEFEKLRLELIRGFITAGSDIVNGIFDRDLQKASARKEMELAMAGDNEKQREQIEEQFAKKKAQIQRKQAIADKIAALFNIGLNIAIGISSALKTPVLIPFIAALGAVQAATVIATPIPQFAKGTSKSPDTFIAGEKGRELMIDPTGHMMMANSPTMFTGMKGTKIISNKETETMIGAALTLRSNSQIEGAIREGNREIINTIRNKKEITIFASKKKIVERTGNYFKTYENAKITE